MNNNITINTKKNTIEITKKFAAAAKRFGTTEYEDLQSVRRDYPQYRIEVRTAAKKADTFKGLTINYMESYIQKHDNEQMQRDFYILCGKNEDGSEQEFAAAASYGEIKKWFLDQHTELMEQRNKIDAILNKKAALLHMYH